MRCLIPWWRVHAWHMVTSQWSQVARLAILTRLVVAHCAIYGLVPHTSQPPLSPSRVRPCAEMVNPPCDEANLLTACNLIPSQRSKSSYEAIVISTLGNLSAVVNLIYIRSKTSEGVRASFPSPCHLNSLGMSSRLTITLARLRSS